MMRRILRALLVASALNGALALALAIGFWLKAHPEYQVFALFAFGFASLAAIGYALLGDMREAE